MSEIFPLEIRATAIACFFVAAQGAGAVAPWVFGLLIEESAQSVFLGYLVGAGMMALGGAVAWRYGVDAERRSLEDDRGAARLALTRDGILVHAGDTNVIRGEAPRSLHRRSDPAIAGRGPPRCETSAGPFESPAFAGGIHERKRRERPRGAPRRAPRRTLGGAPLVGARPDERAPDAADLPRLAALLHDPKVDVRHAVVIAIAVAHGPDREAEVVPLLVERALTDASLRVRRQAVSMLAWQLAHPDLEGFFAQLAESESDEKLVRFARAGRHLARARAKREGAPC